MGGEYRETVSNSIKGQNTFSPDGMTYFLPLMLELVMRLDTNSAGPKNELPLPNVGFQGLNCPS